MVEAAVVLPVMIAMLGISMMMHQAYASKLNSNQQIRSQVLDYASHNCKSQKITYSGTNSGMGGFDTGSGGTGAGADNISGGAAGAAGGGAKSSGMMAKAETNYQTKTINNPKPNTSTEGAGLTLKVNGEKSTALCNEEPEDGSIGGVLGYAKNKLSSIF
jgi:hypothetical protein